MSIIEDKHSYNVTEPLLDNEAELETNYNRNDVYPMNDVKVEKGFFTVFELKRKYDDPKGKKIVLDSSFQRDNVWKAKQKSELVESILMGLPLPIFYFNQDQHGRLIVVDGRQRLTALFEFLDNEYALSKLNILSNLSGMKFKDLEPPLYQSKLEDYQIQAHIIMPPTPDRIKFDIFDRVNRAGTQLNKQEIRNALYQGNATELLKQLKDSKAFALSTDGSFGKETRMRDRHIILRFISFYLYFNGSIVVNNEPYEYKNDIDDLLGKTMSFLNNCKEEQLENVKKVTIFALENTFFYLGGNAFRINTGEKGERKSPINMNIFEVVMYMMAYLPKKRDAIKEGVKVSVGNALQSNDFRNSIGDGRDHWNKVLCRFNIAKRVIEEFSHDF